MIKTVFGINKKKFVELYRDTSSWEQFDGYLRSLENFQVMKHINEEQSKDLYNLSKQEYEKGEKK